MRTIFEAKKNFGARYRFEDGFIGLKLMAMRVRRLS